MELLIGFSFHLRHAGRCLPRSIVAAAAWLPLPWMLGLAAMGIVADPATAADAPTLQAEHRSLDAAYGAQLAQLAEQCEADDLPEAAARLRDWLPASRPDRLYLYVLPTPSPSMWAADEAATGPPGNAAAEISSWQSRFAELRQQQAAALMELARRAVEQGELSLAWQLAVQAVREHPEEAAARQLLGYQRQGEHWLTGYEIAKSRARQAWDPRFGWLPIDRIARYAAGQRYHQGRWISAEQDTALHSTIARGWQVATEHYEVKTNQSLAAGASLAHQLERLAAVWRQLFTRYAYSQDDLLARLEGRSSGPRIPPRFNVVYFRNREEYIAALEKQQPNIGITSGIYLGDADTAYFFAGGDELDSNLYHEATHQLFGQTRSTVRRPGSRGNFWIVEGIACYLESLEFFEGYCSLGGYDAVRLNDARVRLLRDDFYVPLEELVGYNIEDLQRHPRIATLYSQAAGLTHFLMHYDHGRYREALVDYLLAVYTGRDTPRTLAELTGASYSELDSQYRSFIESTLPAAR